MGKVLFFKSEDESIEKSQKTIDLSKEYLYSPELKLPNEEKGVFYSYIELESPITCPLHSNFIAGRLDTNTDVGKNIKISFKFSRDKYMSLGISRSNTPTCRVIKAKSFQVPNS